MFGSFGIALLTGNVLWAAPGAALAAILPINALFSSKPAQILKDTDIKTVQPGDKKISDAVLDWCFWQQFRTAASVLALAATLYLLAFAK